MNVLYPKEYNNNLVNLPIIELSLVDRNITYKEFNHGFLLLTKHDNNANIVVMQLIDLAKELETVGLTEKQARVYVASLSLGAATVKRIGEQAEVNRATTYVILDELSAMGLVSETNEKKKTLFVAEPPEAIGRYLNFLEKDIKERKEKLQTASKSLEGISRIENVDAPVVRFFKGPEAIQAVEAYTRRKAIKNETVYAISDIDEVMKVFPDILIKGPQRRKKKNVESKMFYSGSKDVPTDKSSGRTTKKLNEKAKADVSIYKDRMTILSYKGPNSTGVIIEKKEIVGVFRQLFELAWEKQSNKK